MSEMQKELEKTREFAEKVREKMGVFPNPEPSENERIYIGLTNNKLTKGKRYCPCFIVEGNTEKERKEANNRVCPCKPALQKEIPEKASILFPNTAYGITKPPTQKTILFKNATVWTNESRGVINNCDLAIKNGMTSLRNAGVEKIKTGQTTIEEVLRATVEDN